MKGQNFASQVLSRHTFRISRKKGSDFFYHRGTLSKQDVKQYRLHVEFELARAPLTDTFIRYDGMRIIGSALIQQQL